MAKSCKPEPLVLPATADDGDQHSQHPGSTPAAAKQRLDQEHRSGCSCHQAKALRRTQVGQRRREIHSRRRVELHQLGRQQEDRHQHSGPPDLADLAPERCADKQRDGRHLQRPQPQQHLRGRHLADVDTGSHLRVREPVVVQPFASHLR